MEIPGWAYILVGVIISLISGIIYKTVPKNGQPNMAMALFFVIGMIFIIIGVIKFFFKKMDNSDGVRHPKLNNLQQEHHKTHQVHKIHQANTTQEHTNRVEAHINKIYTQNQQNQNTTINKPVSNHTTPQTHTNQYAKTHHYPGAHPEVINNTIKPAQVHTTTHMPNTNNSNTANTAHNSQVSALVCKRCGNNNSAASNYCHQCGNRIR